VAKQPVDDAYNCSIYILQKLCFMWAKHIGEVL